MHDPSIAASTAGNQRRWPSEYGWTRRSPIGPRPGLSHAGKAPARPRAGIARLPQGARRFGALSPAGVIFAATQLPKRPRPAFVSPSRNRRFRGGPGRRFGRLRVPRASKGRAGGLAVFPAAIATCPAQSGRPSGRPGGRNETFGPTAERMLAGPGDHQPAKTPSYFCRSWGVVSSRHLETPSGMLVPYVASDSS
jgi:hypothetical protein